ncbi:hypothetical protein [Halomicrococcus sp. NG-SE-24]|uniref:hypothetical protein n=1 Tax=Halomicrococcus sp. NG-SE-24 TaxID=3436928 RepID=UPI003D98DC8F
MSDMSAVARSLDATIPFFAVLPAFVGIVVLVWFFFPDLSNWSSPPTRENEYSFDLDELE